VPEGSDDGLQIGVLVARRRRRSVAQVCVALVVAKRHRALPTARVFSRMRHSAERPSAADALVSISPAAAIASLGLVGRVVFAGCAGTWLAALSSVLVMADLSSALKVGGPAAPGRCRLPAHAQTISPATAWATAAPLWRARWSAGWSRAWLFALSTSAENIDLPAYLSTVLSVAIADRAIRESRIGRCAMPACSGFAPWAAARRE
jgi:hypothetical protein